MLGSLSHPVTARLGFRLRDRGIDGDQGLLDARRALAGGIPQRIRLNGNAPPANQVEPLGAAGVLHELPGQIALPIPVVSAIVREEDHRQARPGGSSGEEPEPPRLLEDEGLRQWQQHPRPIPRTQIGRDGATMTKPVERGQGCVDDFPGCSPSGVGDEADSACIVLESGVVKARASQSPRHRTACGERAPQTIAHKTLGLTWMLDTTGRARQLDPYSSERCCQAPSAPTPGKTAPLPTVT